jgi:hypothetical protein
MDEELIPGRMDERSLVIGRVVIFTGRFTFHGRMARLLTEAQKWERKMAEVRVDHVVFVQWNFFVCE